MNESLGDRMKEYENVWRVKLPNKFDVIIRIDGKAFHTYTKGCDKPFDHKIMDAMVYTAFKTAKEIQGFKMAYIQSDEASFYFNDKMNLESDAWFDNNLQKIVSVSASTFTANFNLIMNNGKTAIFDSRAFIVPEEEIANYFVWRSKDWERNSLNMYCESFFSHKELQGKNNQQRHEMLHKIGKNWSTDLSPKERNGTFIFKGPLAHYEKYDILPTYSDISKAMKENIQERLEE